MQRSLILVVPLVPYSMEILGSFLSPWYAVLIVKDPDEVRFHEASCSVVLIGIGDSNKD